MGGKLKLESRECQSVEGRLGDWKDMQHDANLVLEY